MIRYTETALSEVQKNPPMPERVDDLEDGTAELADTLDAATADTEAGLCELADAVDANAAVTEIGMCELADQVAALEERLAALEAAKKGE